MARTNVRYQDVATREQFSAAVTELIAGGFVVQRESSTEMHLTKPKRFGPKEWLSVLYGLICFIIPALIYIAIWSARPPEVVIVRLAPAGQGNT